MLTISDLTFSYENKGSVLKEINVQFAEGTLCTVAGRNGCGKSTLLKLIAGILKSDRGKIEYDGNDIRTLSILKLSKLISYIPQNFMQLFPFTVKEMIMMGRHPHSEKFSVLYTKQDHDITQDVMEDVGISHLQNEKFTKLSGGEKQLTLLSRAFVQDTSLFLLDEPTASLDLKYQARIMKILKRKSQEGKTVLITMHNFNLVLPYTDTILLISNHRVVAFGKPLDVLNDQILTDCYDTPLTYDKKRIEFQDVESAGN